MGLWKNNKLLESTQEVNHKKNKFVHLNYLSVPVRTDDLGGDHKVWLIICEDGKTTHTTLWAH